MQQNEDVKSKYSNDECEDCLSNDKCMFSECEFHLYNCIGYISRRKINDSIYKELVNRLQED